jgi:hypothetical protein
LDNKKLCVVTGPNTSGKSLLRKLLAEYHYDQKMELMSASQSERCGKNLYGLQKAMIYGSEKDDSTGFNSIKLVRKMIQTASGREKPFSFILDEPEIGCSEELQAAIGLFIANSDYLNNKNLKGSFIITHSRLLVKNLMSLNPTHICLGENPYSLSDWINRTIEPVNLDDVINNGSNKWSKVQTLLKK